MARRHPAFPTILTVVLATLAGNSSADVAAQTAEPGRSGPRQAMDLDREIVLARSAAPAAVSGDATILTWTGERWDTAVPGANGVTCYVARSWPNSLEPHCFDEIGSRTILRIHLRQMELLHAGMSMEEVDAQIAEALEADEFDLPDRPAMSYMMSSGQRLVSPDGRVVGRWKPHLMIYYPYLTERDIGGASGTVIVVDPGSPFSNLMVPVPEFVDPALPDDTPGG